VSLDPTADEIDPATTNPAEQVRRSAIALTALSQSGLFYAVNEYDTDRYQKLGALAAELLAAVTEAAPARDSVGLPGHRWIIGIEPGRTGVTAHFGDEHRRKEVASRGAQAGLPHCGPLVVGARSIESDELRTAPPVRREAHVETHI